MPSRVIVFEMDITAAHARYSKSLCFALVALLVASASVHPALAQTVSVWVTTDDQKTKLQQQSSISFSRGSGSGGPNLILIDENQKYQIVEGFGASFTDSAAYLLNQKAPAAQLNAVMNSLFDRTTGIAVSFVRNPMGASDLAR